MTAEQIRAEKISNASNITSSNPSREEQLQLLIYAAIYEVAAQLAELNDSLRPKNWSEGCQEAVSPYWNTLLQCTSETCHRPLPCAVHGAKP